MKNESNFIYDSGSKIVNSGDKRRLREEDVNDKLFSTDLPEEIDSDVKCKNFSAILNPL